MLFKSSVTLMAVATMAVISSFTPQADAHSWLDCADWRWNNKAAKKKNDWSASSGYCKGFARRYPAKQDKPNYAFAKMDDIEFSRQYRQNLRKNTLPCSNHHVGLEPGADETRAPNVLGAYGGKYGDITTTTSGSELCFRWPAKNHAAPKTSVETFVDIYFTDKPNRADPMSQAAMAKYLITKPTQLRFRNCNAGKVQDTRPCGGCITVPKRAPGIYLLQWRWRLNKGKTPLDDEWYASCADIKVTK
ncbi:hypothetical protein B0O80DRAFT_444351 [Mortierella sp. GBAus27b]|nr:hypothetical protein BGX31_001038 [Mortierella sp. GBA43]KAI8358255.1 hypothetical protein B0O80DRAFT_444351 [Mortierella sp. GBAus27b]